MSTIILSSIFGQAGSIFGPIGRIIGSELGALLGAQLDSAMFGLDAEQKVRHGARLKNLQVQTSTYGRTIPIIYGTARVAGNIIWSQPIKEEAITTKSKIGRGMNANSGLRKEESIGNRRLFGFDGIGNESRKDMNQKINRGSMASVFNF